MPAKAWQGSGTVVLMDDGVQKAQETLKQTTQQTDSSKGEITYADNADAPKKKTKSQLQTTLGGLVGNILEWYDFAVYGAMVENIGAAFFPNDCESPLVNLSNDTFANETFIDGFIGINGTSTSLPTTTMESLSESGCAGGNLIESFAVFGGAFLMRPVGALIFGHIGDKYGRKRALELSVLLMCIATIMMGCLPTYKQAGIIAPILLCFVRLLQGVSVGGELIGSIVYTIETAPPNRYGLYGCLALMTAVMGTTLGQGVGAIMHAVLDADSLNDWGWRVPFLFGIFLGTFAIWLRNNIEDSEEFLKMASEGKLSKNPLKDAVTVHLKATIVVFWVALVSSNYFYVCFIWLRVYMHTILPTLSGHHIDNAPGIVTGSLVLLFLCFPPWGYVSDLVGSRRKVMSGAGIGLSLLTIPMFAILARTDSTGVAFAVMSVFAVLCSGWAAPMCAWMVEAFPSNARYSAVAIGYNIASSVTGGAPLLCTYLATEVTLMAPAYYLTTISFLGTITILFSSKILKVTYAPKTIDVMKTVEVEMETPVSPTSTDA